MSRTREDLIRCALNQMLNEVLGSDEISDWYRKDVQLLMDTYVEFDGSPSDFPAPIYWSISDAKPDEEDNDEG